MASKRPPPKNPSPPEQEGNGDDKRPRHRPQGRERQVHEDILERRWQGSPEPTPEKYRRALEQWKNLPGSIVRPATDHEAPGEAPPEPPADAPEGDRGSTS